MSLYNFLLLLVFLFVYQQQNDLQISYRSNLDIWAANSKSTRFHAAYTYILQQLDDLLFPDTVSDTVLNSIKATVSSFFQNI